MKAYVLAAPGVIQCSEEEAPRPGAGELLTAA